MSIEHSRGGFLPDDAARSSFSPAFDRRGRNCCGSGRACDPVGSRLVPSPANSSAHSVNIVGAPEALAVNSCSSGLQLALDGSWRGPGDEVITSPMTFCSTVLAILHAGATPVLADAGPMAISTLNQWRPASPRGRRHFCRFIWGQSLSDGGTLGDCAQRHGLFVVEDAAHASRRALLWQPSDWRRFAQRCSRIQFLRHQESDHWRGRYDHHAYA